MSFVGKYCFLCDHGGASSCYALDHQRIETKYRGRDIMAGAKTNGRSSLFILARNGSVVRLERETIDGFNGMYTVNPGKGEIRFARWLIWELF